MKHKQNTEIENQNDEPPATRFDPSNDTEIPFVKGKKNIKNSTDFLQL